MILSLKTGCRLLSLHTILASSSCVQRSLLMRNPVLLGKDLLGPHLISKDPIGDGDHTQDMRVRTSVSLSVCLCVYMLVYVYV